MTRTTARDDVFRAIADPSRRLILDALSDGPKGFRDLHALLPVTKGAVSQHITVLTSVGLVAVNASDPEARYRLTPDPLAEVAQWLSAYRGFWEESLDRLESAVQERRRRGGTR